MLSWIFGWQTQNFAQEEKPLLYAHIYSYTSVKVRDNRSNTVTTTFSFFFISFFMNHSFLKMFVRTFSRLFHFCVMNSRLSCIGFKSCETKNSKCSMTTKQQQTVMSTVDTYYQLDIFLSQTTNENTSFWMLTLCEIVISRFPLNITLPWSNVRLLYFQEDVTHYQI